MIRISGSYRLFNKYFSPLISLVLEINCLQIINFLFVLVTLKSFVFVRVNQANGSTNQAK